MLRPLWSVNGSFTSHTRRALQKAKSASTRLLATQSSGDVEPPTALANLYLEDGTKLTGQSFGCHEAVEGEVSGIDRISQEQISLTSFFSLRSFYITFTSDRHDI